MSGKTPLSNNKRLLSIDGKLIVGNQESVTQLRLSVKALMKFIPEASKRLEFLKAMGGIPVYFNRNSNQPISYTPLSASFFDAFLGDAALEISPEGYLVAGDSRQIIGLEIVDDDPTGKEYIELADLLTQLGTSVATYQELIGRGEKNTEAYRREVEKAEAVTKVMKEMRKRKRSESDPEEFKIIGSYSHLNKEKFVEREKIIRALEEKFLEIGNEKREVTIVTLCGLSGSGKTQLALNYFTRPPGEYIRTIWCTAINQNELLSSYRQICDGLKIKIDKYENPKVIFSKVKSWLEENPGWLIVYDGVTDFEELKKILPIRGGHILITSIHPWERKISVSNMETTEAVSLIKKIISGADQPPKLDADMVELVSKLSRFPLALAQAGTYISERGISIKKYLEDYERIQLKLLSYGKLPPGDEHASVTVTFTLVKNAVIEEGRKNDLPVDEILHYCAYLNSEQISRELLTQAMIGPYIEWFLTMSKIKKWDDFKPNGYFFLQEEGGCEIVYLDRQKNQKIIEIDSIEGVSEEKIISLPSADRWKIDDKIRLYHSTSSFFKEDSDVIDDALALLARYSLLELSEDHVLIHCLLQVVIENLESEENRRRYIEHLLKTSYDVFNIDFERCDQWEKNFLMVKNNEALVIFAKKYNIINKNLISVMIPIGEFYAWQVCNLDHAMDVLLKTNDLVCKVQEKEEYLVFLHSSTLSNIGQIFFKQRKIPQAIWYTEQAILKAQEIHDLNINKHLFIVNLNLMEILIRREYHEKNIDRINMEIRVFLENNILIKKEIWQAHYKMNLGKIFLNKASLKEALVCFNEAKIIFEAEKHVNALIVINYIGEVYLMLGDFEKALDAFTDAYALTKNYEEKINTDSEIAWAYKGFALGIRDGGKNIKFAYRCINFCLSRLKLMYHQEHPFIKKAKLLQSNISESVKNSSSNAVIIQKFWRKRRQKKEKITDLHPPTNRM